MKVNLRGNRNDRFYILGCQIYHLFPFVSACYAFESSAEMPICSQGVTAMAPGAHLGLGTHYVAPSPSGRSPSHTECWTGVSEGPRLASGGK